MRAFPARVGQSGKGAVGCLVIGGVLVVLAVACSYFGYKFGTKKLAEVVAQQLKDNPVVVEHLGEIQETEFDMMATAAQAKEGDAKKDVPARFVFQVVGTKGRGRLIVVVPQESAQEFAVQSGVLEMEGQVYDLGLLAAPAEQAPSPEAPGGAGRAPAPAGTR